MTAIHHLLVTRSECRRGRSRRSPRSCAGARSRASTVNRGRRFAAPLCAEPARRGASVSGAACTLRETRHALARTLATPARSPRSPQHRGLAPHRVRSRPGPGPSGPERRFDRPASGGTDVVRHRTWRTRALLAIGRITLSASPQRGLGVPLYDNKRRLYSRPSTGATSRRITCASCASRSWPAGRSARPTTGPPDGPAGLGQRGIRQAVRRG